MKSRRAFTLLELILVIAVIAILAAILYGVIVAQIRKGRAAASMNNLKQWYTALTSSLGENDGRMPFDGEGASLALQETDAWFNRLPIYLQEKSLSDASWAQRPPRPGDRSVWVNPAVPTKDATPHINAPQSFFFSYGMNTFLSTSIDRNQKFNLVERPAATVFMAEKCNNLADCDPGQIRAYFGDSDPVTGRDNAAHFLFCDGHVELRKRSTFDLTMIPIDAENPSPTDNVILNQSFTFIPYVGATAN